mmetsp:Transcript_50389/g.150663  ORF Transcript_50389/g.150663 Transcript_50389/m.150663 type:complete len:267 (-) Transcript_50389:132-932(-)
MPSSAAVSAGSHCRNQRSNVAPEAVRGERDDRSERQRTSERAGGHAGTLSHGSHQAPPGERPVGGGNSSAASNDQGRTVMTTPGPGAGDVAVPMSNYAFFVKYTYSNECALLAYNFHELVTKLGIFEQFAYRHDHRLISVTLAYIFYRYQVHHCDMALDLALTLVYLEDVKAPGQTELQEQGKDAFNLICYLAFLAHAFNADRTIRLSDWYREIGWRSFSSCQQLNGYVFFLFSQVRRFRLRVSETRVKRYIQKLCSVPSQIQESR